MLAKKVYDMMHKKGDGKPHIILPQQRGIPSLQELARDVVAENFERYPHLQGVPEKIKAEIISRTRPAVPIPIAAIYIEDEEYWRKVCEATYGKPLPHYNHGGSYKQAFLETYLEQYLEKLKPEDDEGQMRNLLRALSGYIFSLRITQLPSHLNIALLFKYLRNLSSLSITYGAKHLGTKYERVAFGIMISDAVNIEECIRMSKTLVSLSMPGNMIDKDIIQRLIRSLILNTSITQLDLSHNLLGDLGARRIAKYIVHTKILTHLNLCDNNIHYEGSRYISKAMKNNKSIISLNLKHNRIDDAGGAKFCDDLTTNPRLQELNLAANSLSHQFCEKFCMLIGKNNVLSNIDLSCNFMEDKDGEMLLEAIKSLAHITVLDVRNNKISNKKLVEDIHAVAQKNYVEKMHIPFVRSEEPETVPAADSPAPANAETKA